MTPAEILSARELEIYELRTGGMRNKDIAIKLNLSAVCVAVTWANANTRIASGQPSDRTKRRLAATKRAREVRAEKRCTLCQLRGHLPGDPERCLVGAAKSLLDRRIYCGP